MEGDDSQVCDGRQADGEPLSYDLKPAQSLNPGSILTLDESSQSDDSDGSCINELASLLPSLKTEAICNTFEPIYLKKSIKEIVYENNTIGDISLDKHEISHIIDCCAVEINEILKTKFDASISRRNLTAFIQLSSNQGSDNRVKEICQTIGEYIKDNFKSIRFDTGVEKWEFAKSKLNKFLSSMNDGNRVSVFFDSGILVIGKKEDIEEFRNCVLSDVLSDEIVSQHFSINDDTMKILQLINYERQIRSIFSVELDMNETLVSVRGLQEDVLALQLNIKTKECQYRLLKIKLTKGQVAILQNKHARKLMESGFPIAFKSKWRIENDVLLIVRGSQDKSSERKLDLRIFERKYTLTKFESETLFVSSKWDKFSSLLSTNNGIVITEVNGCELILTCMSDKKQHVELALESFRKENELHEKRFVYECKDHIKNFCLQFKKDEIQNIAKAMKEEFLKIEFDSKNEMKITGTKAGLQSCSEVLSQTLDNKRYKHVCFGLSIPKIVKYHASEHFKQIWQKISMQNRCLLETRLSISIRLQHGSITDAMADVLVNSVHSDVNASVAQSTVALAILRKGGHEFGQKLTEAACGLIKHGDVVTVNATGSLNCKEVFNVCLIPNAVETKTVKDVVYSSVTKCLTLAEQRRYKSIVFPALGTGTYKYPADIAAEGILDALLDYSNATENSSITEIIVVVFPEDPKQKEVIQAFQNEFQRRTYCPSDPVFPEWNPRRITSGRLEVTAETEEAINKAMEQLKEEIHAHESGT